MKREFIPMSGLYDMNIGALRMYYAQRPTPKPENEVKTSFSGATLSRTRIFWKP